MATNNMDTYNSSSNNRINNDCPAYFRGSVCEDGSNCNYRHSEAARGSLHVCPDWARGLCTLWSACPLRHAPAPVVEQGLVSAGGAVIQSGLGQGWSFLPDFRSVDMDGFIRSSSFVIRNEANNQNNQTSRKGTLDCKFYFSGFCNKGDSCLFRHSTAALGSGIICEDWKRRRNCPFKNMCNKRHSNVNFVVETNNRYIRTMTTMAASGNAAANAGGAGGSGLVPDYHKKKATDDCRDYIYKECTRGEICKLRHSSYVKDSRTNGTWDHLGVCPNWDAKPKRNCASCFMLHHIPPQIFCSMKDENAATSSKSAANHQKKEEKKSNEVKFECKICFLVFDEIKEKGDRIVAADCGHTMCEMCCRSIMRSTEPICPFCRMVIKDPRPLFLS